LHKRWRFGVKAEHWPVEQARLFEPRLSISNSEVTYAPLLNA
jgi:hypothetical protein